MLDALSVRDANTLELKLKTSEEALDFFRKLEDMQRQEKRLGNEEGLPADFSISISGTTVLIQGESVRFALIIANKQEMLSSNRLSALGEELRELRRREELSQQIANRKGIFAARRLGKPIPNKPNRKAELPDEIKALIEKQRTQPSLISLIRTK